MDEKRVKTSFDTERISGMPGLSVSSAIMLLAAGVTRPDRIEAALTAISEATGIPDRNWLYGLDYEVCHNRPRIVAAWNIDHPDQHLLLSNGVYTMAAQNEQ